VQDHINKIYDLEKALPKMEYDDQARLLRILLYLIDDHIHLKTIIHLKIISFNPND